MSEARAETATRDALNVTAKAAERASEVLASSAGQILTRSARYYERLLHQLLVGVYVEGAMAGSELTMQRFMSGMTGAAVITPLPDLEEASTRVELERVQRPSEPTLPTAEVLRGRRQREEWKESDAGDAVDSPTWPGGEDP